MKIGTVVAVAVTAVCVQVASARADEHERRGEERRQVQQEERRDMRHEEVARGFGLVRMSTVEDDALDRCSEESGGDQSCFLATGSHF